MAYWEFDLTFVNRDNLPDNYVITIATMVFSSDSFSASAQGGVTGSDTQTLTINTAAPEYIDNNGTSNSVPSFELDATDQFWVTIHLMHAVSYTWEGAWTIGPYVVGDVGTEVSMP